MRSTSNGNRFISSVTEKLCINVLEYLISSSTLKFSVTSYKSQPWVTKINFQLVRVFHQNNSLKIPYPDKKFTNTNLKQNHKIHNTDIITKIVKHGVMSRARKKNIIILKNKVGDFTVKCLS